MDATHMLTSDVWVTIVIFNIVVIANVTIYIFCCEDTVPKVTTKSGFIFVENVDFEGKLMCDTVFVHVPRLSSFEKIKKNV